jgi:AcrR family transcriptional regulator
MSFLQNSSRNKLIKSSLGLKLFAGRSTREQTRQRILVKANELIRRFGLTKTAVADIAAALGMSPANVYAG